jgi:hypothetical protein
MSGERCGMCLQWGRTCDACLSRIGELIACVDSKCTDRYRCQILSECQHTVDQRRKATDEAVEGVIRTFTTGATRNNDADKPDYDGFLAPSVIARFGAYMHKNRRQADGSLRDSSNWQKGIPREAYMKSAWRHHVEWWTLHHSPTDLTETQQEALEEALCAVLFNAQGYLFELLKARRASS